MLATGLVKLTRLLMCWICFFSLSQVALAKDQLVRNVDPLAGSPVIHSSPIKQNSASSEIFARPVFLRGVLGGIQIQMHLHPHSDYEDSVQGDYFSFGKSEKIMLAGEFQEGDLAMEESVNGTDVSGQWIGKLEGAVFRGTWYSDDQSRTKPFELSIFEPKNVMPSAVPITKAKVKATSVNARNNIHRD